MLQAAKLEGQSHLSLLKFKLTTSDIELKDLTFSLLGFSLVLVQYFPTMPPFLLFGMEMLFCANVYQKHIIYVLILQEVTIKRFF